jgi:hypothetical protein
MCAVKKNRTEKNPYRLDEGRNTSKKIKMYFSNESVREKKADTAVIVKYSCKFSSQNIKLSGQLFVFKLTFKDI